jgi:aspartyl-tRNA(Asn)/glutamyl-tRNA(Gln) amidotransferase subunit B
LFFNLLNIIVDIFLEVYKVEFETRIGLEVHVELHTNTKLFCGCENRFGAQPNSLTCPVCLGLPGTLPVINEEAINKHIKTALALNCRIADYSKFDRKNYFYPDMPKNYQISQYDLPVAEAGFIEIEDDDGAKKKIRITRIHLEEDTGKSIHAGEARSIADADYTLLNYNRAGVPLLEIVSEPDLYSPEEAYRYLNQLKNILNWLQVSDCKMEEGSLRCDANISIREIGEFELGTKVEIKNLNSFRAVRSALEYERERQEEVIRYYGRVTQETRGWEADKGITISMRSKEEAHDYRYFPEPDLAPLVISEEWKNEISDLLPEMPYAMAERFVTWYDIPEYDAGVLTSYKDFADFYEEAVAICNDPKQVSNWMMGDISKYLNENNIEIRASKLTPQALGKMITMIRDEIISGKIGKDLVQHLLKHGGDPARVTQEKGWMQIVSKEELLPHVKKAIEDNPDVLENYLKGKESAKQFLVGQVMKATRGKASPKAVTALLDYELAILKGEEPEEVNLPERSFLPDPALSEPPREVEEKAKKTKIKVEMEAIEAKAFAATMNILSSSENKTKEDVSRELLDKMSGTSKSKEKDQNGDS